MEKAIEIKRRAQRCIQNGDLDGALNEYEKLVGAEESDPYNFVLLADLLYKKGEHGGASQRYLSAVSSYEKAALYKNAIAVCKKMLRLSLSAAEVTRQLAQLHALDGLSSEAALYYVQYAEFMVRSNEPTHAAEALRKAFESAPENVKVLEQLAEAWLLAGENDQAVATLEEAVQAYRERGLALEAQRVEQRLRSMTGQAPTVTAAPTAEAPAAPHVPSGTVTTGRTKSGFIEAPTSLHDLLEPGRVNFEAPTQPAAPPPGVVSFDLEPGVRTLNDALAPAAEASSAEAFAPEAESIADEPVEEKVLDLDAALDEAPAIAAETTAEAESDDVYEITEEDAQVSYEAAERTLEEIAAESAPPSPSVHFGATDAFPAAEAPAPEPVAAVPTLADVEHLLAEAQDHFRAGHRDQASDVLARAASAYEQLGRWDSAATIYRSLGRSASTPQAVLLQWLANCEMRQDRGEAAQVSCELGDRALNEGQDASAREWFERAQQFDENNETARRRLARLAGTSAAGGVATATNAPAPAADLPEGGRVEVAVGRGEAVTFDLGSLLAEFQRGVEAQLSGDAQSHYDLGMTYREMGLLDQAVESFRVASQSAPLAARSHEMIGRCFADMGRLAEAIAEFHAALTQLGASADLAIDLHHELGCALEAAGRSAEAVPHFERVVALHPDFADAAQRLEALRRREAA